jgi:PAS domain S-box-containing protein
MRIRPKTILAFLAAGLICVIGTAAVLTWVAEKALEQAVIRNMIAVRESKADALRTHFASLRLQMAVLTECPIVSQGIVELADAMEKLPAEWNGPIDSDALAKEIADSETRDFSPTGLPGELTPAQMVAVNLPGRLAQALYIARNSHPASRRDLADAGDDSSYTKAHARLHPAYLAYYDKFQFYDFYLIDLDGRVVYSVNKQMNFGTNLATGPLKDTSLARAFAGAKQAGRDDPVWIEPFTFAPPSGMIPASTIAHPLFHDGKKVGVLAARISVAEIDAITSGHGRWREEGLGETGEVYFVGSNHTLRSNTRPSIENINQYVEDLRKTGLDENTLSLIARFKSGILIQPIHSEAANRAMAGESGVAQILSYLGKPAIIAYQPFDISPTARWGLVVKMDTAEAFAPVRKMRRDAILIGIGSALAITVFAWFLSGLVIGPLKKLATHAGVLGKGNLKARIRIHRDDEIGTLATAFNDMAQALETTTVSKDFVSGIIESMMDPLLVTSAPQDGKAPTILRANRAATSLLNYSADALPGQSLNAICHSDSDWWRRIVAGQAVHGIELDWRSAAGQTIPMLFSAATLNDHAGRPAAVVCIGHDLRNRKQAELVAREKNRLQSELDLARHVQLSLLPKESLDIPGYEMAGWSQAAVETGGDYFDWLRLSDGRIIVSIADATGHGIGPALLVAVCRAYFRAATQMDSAIEQAVARVNNLMALDLPDGRFVTVAVCTLDPDAHQLKMYSAGHAPIMYYHAGDAKVMNFDADDLPLGIQPDMTAGTPKSLDLAPGDVLLLTTDGFFEWMNPEGEQYGISRLESFLETHHALPSDEMIRRLHADVLAFARGTVQKDDLTAVVIKRIAG